MICTDYQTTKTGTVCIHYLPNGSCKHVKHVLCNELFGDFIISHTPEPPCPLGISPAKNEIKTSKWSGCGQGWSGWTLTTFCAILLMNIPLVRVVRAKTHISHMCESIYSYIVLFLISFLWLNFDFVRKYPDHPDHPRNHSAFTLTSYPDQP